MLTSTAIDPPKFKELAGKHFRGDAAPDTISMLLRSRRHCLAVGGVLALILLPTRQHFDTESFPPCDPFLGNANTTFLFIIMSSTHKICEEEQFRSTIC